MKNFSKIIFNQIRSVVFGVEDGLLSTLGVMTGIAAGTNNKGVIILSGFVVVLVEALSMGAGTYLSSKSEKQAQEKLVREELERIKQNPEEERKELVKMYEKRGYHKSEIDRMVNHVMKDEKLLLEEMAHKELGIITGKTDNSIKSSLYMFFSYIIAGFIVVVPYVLPSVKAGIIVSIIIAALGLFLLGYYKGHLTDINKKKSGLEMLIIAIVVALAGYIIGYIIGHIIGLL